MDGMTENGLGPILMDCRLIGVDPEPRYGAPRLIQHRSLCQRIVLKWDEARGVLGRRG